ncbi:MAG: hypothetical protein ACOCRN_05455, partial [Spirochaetia bacterium]
MVNPTDPVLIAPWYDLLSDIPPWDFLPNPRVDDEAWYLFVGNGVRITFCSGDELYASVTEGPRIYHPVLRFDGRSLHLRCDCSRPSPPCKHVGALAYAVLETFAGDTDTDSDDEDAPGLDDPDVVPGAELSRRTVRRTRGDVGDGEAAGKLAHAAAAVRGFEPLPDRGVIVDRDGSPVDGEQLPSGSERGKVYRPAFELSIVEDHEFLPRGDGPTLFVRAVLVYIKKDGGDGAVQAYTNGKPRLRAPGLVEHLYRYVAACEGRVAPAASTLAGELERIHDRRVGADETLELHFERQPGESGRRVRVREITDM